jgi:hypothetical protein
MKHAKQEEKLPAVVLLGGDIFRDILSLRGTVIRPSCDKTRLMKSRHFESPIYGKALSI